jgi:6-phosphofructokinase 1
MELTPGRVSEIHTFGGTILGSSRGPQDPEEIVDALERMNVNILFVIGGDGSMKAASAIQKEIFKRKNHIVVLAFLKP